MKERRGQRLKRQLVCVAIEDIYGGVIGQRQSADEPALIELAASIQRHGLLQPVVVRKNPQAGRYALICGARRVAACRMAGMTHLDAIVLDVEEPEAVACYMEEHLTRRAPGFIEEAQAVAHMGAQRVLERFALPAERLRERLAMLALPETVREQAAALTLEQAKPLLRVQGESRQREAASIIAQRDLTGGQALRLVMGPPVQKAAAKTGRRRAMRETMEMLGLLARQLNLQGVPASVTMRAQEGGVCIQMLIRNDEKFERVSRKQQKGRE